MKYGVLLNTAKVQVAEPLIEGTVDTIASAVQKGLHYVAPEEVGDFASNIIRSITSDGSDVVKTTIAAKTAEEAAAEKLTRQRLQGMFGGSDFENGLPSMSTGTPFDLPPGSRPEDFSLGGEAFTVPNVGGEAIDWSQMDEPAPPTFGGSDFEKVAPPRYTPSFASQGPSEGPQFNQGTYEGPQFNQGTYEGPQFNQGTYEPPQFDSGPPSQRPAPPRFFDSGRYRSFNNSYSRSVYTD